MLSRHGSELAGPERPPEWENADEAVSLHSKTPKKILVVVDQLDEFKAQAPFLDELPADWTIHYSTSENDALFFLRQLQFDLVFVDLKKGPLAGAQFLHDVWERQPNVIRFLLADQLEEDLLLTCAMGAHQFLQKPLTLETMQNAVERADLVGQMLKNTRIQTLVSRIRTFPNRPTIYLELMKEIRSANSSAQTVGELVEQDLAITTKLLQVTNSAYFGFQQRILSPGDAVFLLGMQATASLVLAIEVFSHMDHLNPSYFVIDQIWRHSQKVGHSARMIAQKMTRDHTLAQDSFTAGLLHDVGKLALAINLKEEYRAALRLARQNMVPVWKAEQEIFGATHAEAGAYLLGLWGLSFPVIHAVAGHHLQPANLGHEFNAQAAVHLANTLEYSKPPLRTSFPGYKPETDYPLDLGVEPFLEAFEEKPVDAVRPRLIRELAREEMI